MEMIVLDYFILVVISIVLIIGGYQFYFWCQRHIYFKKRTLLTFVDSWFPYQPRWVWIYSFLYYPIIVIGVFTLTDTRHFIYVVFSYLVLLVIHMIIFLIFPVGLPKEWRKMVGNKTLSERFLRLVHTYDGQTNCFPSMHVSVAMLTALHIMTNAPQIGLWMFLFPFFISLSALYTKQHYFADVIPGALLGWISFELFQIFYVIQ